MTELKEEHFEVIDANKARQHNKKTIDLYLMIYLLKKV